MSVAGHFSILFPFDNVTHQHRPPHTDLEVYAKWSTLLLDVFAELNATDADKKAALRENSLAAYRVSG